MEQKMYANANPNANPKKKINSKTIYIWINVSREPLLYQQAQNEDDTRELVCAMATAPPSCHPCVLWAALSESGSSSALALGCVCVSSLHPRHKKKNNTSCSRAQKSSAVEWPDLHRKTAVTYGLHQRELVDYAGVGAQLSRNHSDSSRDRVTFACDGK